MSFFFCLFVFACLVQGSLKRKGVSSSSGSNSSTVSSSSGSNSSTFSYDSVSKPKLCKVEPSVISSSGSNSSTLSYDSDSKPTPCRVESSAPVGRVYSSAAGGVSGGLPTRLDVQRMQIESGGAPVFPFTLKGCRATLVDAADFNAICGRDYKKGKGAIDGANGDRGGDDLVKDGEDGHVQDGEGDHVGDDVSFVTVVEKDEYYIKGFVAGTLGCLGRLFWDSVLSTGGCGSGYAVSCKDFLFDKARSVGETSALGQRLMECATGFEKIDCKVRGLVFQFKGKALQNVGGLRPSSLGYGYADTAFCALLLSSHDAVAVLGNGLNQHNFLGCRVPDCDFCTRVALSFLKYKIDVLSKYPTSLDGSPAATVGCGFWDLFADEEEELVEDLLSRFPDCHLFDVSACKCGGYCSDCVEVKSLCLAEARSAGSDLVLANASRMSTRNGLEAELDHKEVLLSERERLSIVGPRSALQEEEFSQLGAELSKCAVLLESKQQALQVWRCRQFSALVLTRRYLDMLRLCVGENVLDAAVVEL